MIITENEFLVEEMEMKDWQSQEDVPNIDIEQLKYLLKNPPTRCENKSECVSYHLSHDKCRCIRTIFAHRRHYELWKLMAEEKIKSELSHCFDETEEDEEIPHN